MKICSWLCIIIFPALSISGVVCAETWKDNSSVVSEIHDTSGKSIGKVWMTQATNGVLLHISAQNLPEGYHGMHFHTTADCSHQHDFKTAGGHVDPNKKPHGFLNPNGPHEGNLPNLIVSKNGSVDVELYSQLVSLSHTSLLDHDGSALIIHAQPDDHLSQPIGGSGDRIACAVIKSKIDH